MMFPAPIFAAYKRRIFLGKIVRILLRKHSKRQIYWRLLCFLRTILTIIRIKGFFYVIINHNLPLPLIGNMQNGTVAEKNILTGQQKPIRKKRPVLLNKYSDSSIAAILFPKQAPVLPVFRPHADAHIVTVGSDIVQQALAVIHTAGGKSKNHTVFPDGKDQKNQIPHKAFYNTPDKTCFLTVQLRFTSFRVSFHIPC